MTMTDIKDILSAGNKSATIRFTDWKHDAAELVIAQADEHVANVYGTHADIDISAHITDLPDEVTMLVHIKDVTRPGINIMSSVAIDKSLFEFPWAWAEFGAVTKVAQEALQYALTYAGLWNNKATTSLDRMNEVLRSFSHKFANELYDCLKDDTKMVSVKENATLVVA